MNFIRAFFLSLLFIPFSGSMAATVISSLPFVCDQPGEQYTLSSDLVSTSGRAITIAADDVVLDGANHTLTYATSGPGHAIFIASGADRPTIRNFDIVQGAYSPRGGERVHGVGF